MKSKRTKMACRLYATVLAINIFLFLFLFFSLKQEDRPQIIKQEDKPINLRSSQPVAIITRKKQDDGGQKIRP